MRSLRIAAAAALVAALAAVAAPPPTVARADDAPPTCHVEFYVPATLAVSHPKRPIDFFDDQSECRTPVSYTYAVSGGATATTQAPDGGFRIDPYLTDDMRLGRWTWTGNVLTEGNVHGTFNTSVTDVRVGSSVALSVVPSGSRLMLAASASRYWTSTHDTRYYSGAKGQVQYRYSSDEAWAPLAGITTDASGRWSGTASALPGGTVQYRAVLADSTYIWGDISTVVSGRGTAGSAGTHAQAGGSRASAIGPFAYVTDPCLFLPVARAVVSSPQTPLASAYTYPDDVKNDCVNDDPAYYAYGPSGTYTDSAYVRVHREGSTYPVAPVSPQRLPTVTDTMPLGLWSWKDDYDPTYNTVTHPIHTDVRVGSVGYVSATRAGHTVTLTAHAARYWTSAHRFNYYPAAAGQLQYYDAATNAWRGLKDITGDAHGYSTWSGTVTPTRSFRVVYFDTTYVWGATSGATRA